MGEQIKIGHANLGLLISSKLKVLAALQGNLVFMFAGGTFQTKYHLFSGFGLMMIGKPQFTNYLLVKDGLSLTTITCLLAIVASFTLDMERVLALFILRHLVWFMHTTAFAKCIPGFGNIDLLTSAIIQNENNGKHDGTND